MKNVLLNSSTLLGSVKSNIDLANGVDAKVPKVHKVDNSTCVTSSSVFLVGWSSLLPSPGPFLAVLVEVFCIKYHRKINRPESTVDFDNMVLY